MLYADLIPAPVRVRVSNYFLSYRFHFSIYRNADLIEKVYYGQIPWC